MQQQGVVRLCVAAQHSGWPGTGGRDNGPIKAMRNSQREALKVQVPCALSPSFFINLSEGLLHGWLPMQGLRCLSTTSSSVSGSAGSSTNSGSGDSKNASSSGSSGSASGSAAGHDRKDAGSKSVVPQPLGVGPGEWLSALGAGTSCTCPGFMLSDG